MDVPLKFDYYYGIEAEQFSFYRVPRLLIKDDRFKGLSSDAKLLYGLMLDRMALSMRNGWLDEENRAYIIYTIDNIREDLGCSKEKAVKVLAELDTGKGIGLVEKIRRGLGKPDIIYVKNFVVPEPPPGRGKAGENPANADASTEVGKTDFKRSENLISADREIRLQEVGKTDFSRSENLTSKGRENRLQEVGESAPNYTDFNQIKQNHTDMSYTNHINQSGIDGEPGSADNDMIDAMDDASACMEIIKENIEYEHYMKYGDRGDRELYEELYGVICEIVCVKRKTVKVNGEDYPYELVKSKFLKLNSSHLEYVIDSMRDTSTKITNIRAYMVTALYNAPDTMNHYYQQLVQHDMYGGGWEEKGIRRQGGL